MELPEIFAKIEASPVLQRTRTTVKARLAQMYLELSAHVNSTQIDVDTWHSNAKSSRSITKDRVLEKLSFDPATGEFRWLVTHRAHQLAGFVAYQRGKAYRRIRVDNELIMAHALVWLITYGVFPQHELDHKNGNGLDNRPDNLRRSNRLLNNTNTGKREDSARHRAVHKNGGRWATNVKYARLSFYVSGFDTAEDAAVGRDLLETLIPRGANHGVST